MVMKGYSTFPKTSALLEPHHQIFYYHIRTHVRWVLPLCRDATGVFTTPVDYAVGRAWWWWWWWLGINLLNFNNRFLIKELHEKIKSELWVLFFFECFSVILRLLQSKKHHWLCNCSQAWLPNLLEWVQISLGAPYIQPCTTSKQKKKILVNHDCTN